MKLDDIDKILIIKLDHIGDMVLATPLFRSIKERYPKINIDIMLSERAIGVVENSPYIRNIYIYESSDYDRGRKRNQEVLIKNMNTMCSIRNSQYEVCLNLRDDGKNIMIQKLLNIKTLISYNNDTVYPELLDICLYNKKKLHAIYSDFELLKAIDVKMPSHVYPEIFTTEREEEWVEEFCYENKIQNTDIVIGISMGGGWRLNWWPEENYRGLCKRLVEYHKRIKLVFIGGRAEAKEFKWVNDGEQYISALGMTSIGQLAALAKKFDIIVTNDGGPMHVMSTANKPLIALFGPSPDKRYGPVGDNVKVINKRIKCSPCPQYVAKNGVLCENNICMKKISVEEVYEIIIKNIKNRKER